MPTARTPAAEPSLLAPLSPELALVDPDAAALARAALPAVTLYEDTILLRRALRTPPPPPPLPRLRPAAEPAVVPLRRPSLAARALLAAALGALACVLLVVPGSASAASTHGAPALPAAHASW